MSLIHVGVLRGGPSSEYDVSLLSGSTVLKNLSSDKYRPYDIFIDKKGVWHVHGIPTTPDKVLQKIDVVFNALHGEYGEDGKVQSLLETHKVPFTGSGTFASALGMNKTLSKKLFQQHGLKTPLYIELHKDDADKKKIEELFKTFPIPAIVKPVSAGSSVGITVVRTLKELEAAIEHALTFGEKVLIEEYINGTEATCGVVDGFRGEDVHALLPIEIRPLSSHFFDYNSKYTQGGSHEFCPSHFSHEEKNILESYAKIAHKALGARHYSRSDFIVSPRRGIYILEINTLPGLTEFSLLPKSLQAGGTSIASFLDHVIELARGNR